MHGGTSKRGADHPNFRHGRYTKGLSELFQSLLKPRPTRVDVLLFPESMEELAMKIGGKRRLRGFVVPPDQLTVADRLRTLRAARRLLAQELAELRARAANGP
jgi:hypothetical protein